MGSRSILALWRIALLCLMRTIRREHNARWFKDREKSKEELNNILVKSLFTWTGPYNICSCSNFSEFVGFFASFSLWWKLYLYTSYVLGCTPLRFSMKLITYQKKKKEKSKKSSMIIFG
jgi:hypothetical protein